MTTAVPEGYRFVANPPLEAVSQLMQQTWAKPCWVYDVDLLRYHLAKPSGDLELSVGVEDASSGSLVAYNAMMPIAVELHGTPLRAVFGSFLTAGRTVQATQVARRLQAHLVELSLQKGHDLYVAICETGAISGPSITYVSSKLGLRTSTVRSFRYVAVLAEVLRKKLPAAGSSATRAYRPDDADAVERLFALAPRLPLHRAIARRDYEHRFRAPQARSLVYVADGRVRGFVHAMFLGVADEEKRYRNAYFQDLELGDLSPEARREFLSDVLRLLVLEPCDLVFIPESGYFPQELWRPFYFRSAPRSLDLLLTPLDHRLVIDESRQITGFCLDVY